jgi:hypothetical protein
LDVTLRNHSEKEFNSYDRGFKEKRQTINYSGPFSCFFLLLHSLRDSKISEIKRKFNDLKKDKGTIWNSKKLA